MERAIVTKLALILALIPLAGCGDESDIAGPRTTDPVPTQLRVSDPEITVHVPDTATVTAFVYDQHGNVMAALVPSWISRDPSTATVSATGSVGAVASGDTWVVAAAAGLTDSVFVRVRYVVGAGEARVRVRGPNGDGEHALRPWARFYDLLGTETRDRFLLAFDGQDTVIVVLLPGYPTRGNTQMQRLPVDELLDGATIFDLTMPGAYISYEGADGLLLYLSESGVLEVERVEDAAAPGEDGTLAGHLSVTAIGYLLREIDSGNPVAVPTGDTIRFVVDFDVTFVHRVTGFADVRLEGGPSQTDGQVWDAFVDWPNVNPPGTPLVELKVERGSAELALAILDPRPGDLSVFSQDPDGTFAAGTGRTSLRMTSFDPYYRASGQGGTLTLDRVLPPDGARAGELHGRLEASVLYWIDNDPDRSDTGTISMEFHAPWPPRPGSARSPEREDGRTHWDPLLRLRGR